jgi:hypothetical protein
MNRERLIGWRWIVVVSVLTVGGALGAELPKALREQLDSSKYVYIATQRQGGAFGKPSEIWFLHHQGLVWVVSPHSTWRVRRIKAGRPKARIAVGTADGPSFEAVGSLAEDPAVQEVIFSTYAKKYPDGWPTYESRFRQGLKDGSRALIRYTPLQ